MCSYRVFQSAATQFNLHSNLHSTYTVTYTPQYSSEHVTRQPSVPPCPFAPVLSPRPGGAHTHHVACTLLQQSFSVWLLPDWLAVVCQPYTFKSSHAVLVMHVMELRMVCGLQDHGVPPWNDSDADVTVT